MSSFFVRELELREGTLEIYQELEGDVGCVVWDAAICLAKYIDGESFRNKFVLTGSEVLELGSGTGVVGLTAATQGANVVITDLPEFVPLMQKNINHNHFNLKSSCIVKAESLRWGIDMDSGKHYDFILMADLIYYEESIKPLVETMCALSSPETVILMSYEERKTDNKPELQRRFFELVEKYFKLRKIPLCEQDEVYRSDDIHIYEMKKYCKIS